MPTPNYRSYTCCSRVVHRLLDGGKKHRYLLLALLLGQFLSLLLCVTGITSQLLETKHSIAVPTTQAFLNYILLTAVFGVALATTKNFLSVLFHNWWKYAILGVIDVEANYVVILAYKYTSLTSIQLLDSFSIACVMVLSFIFLRTRYKVVNFMGVLLALIGIGSLVMADIQTERGGGATNALLGDMLCLGGAVLYAIGNVAQEYLVKNHSVVEYLGMIGIAGAIVSGVQLILLERTSIAHIEWNSNIGILFAGFGVALFLFYATMPHVMKFTNAVMVNLSLLTADIFTFLFGLFLFMYKFSVFYMFAFLLVLFGVFIYNLHPPGWAKSKRKHDHDSSSHKQAREKAGATAPGAGNTHFTDTVENGGLLESQFSATSTFNSMPGSKPASQSSNYGSTESDSVQLSFVEVHQSSELLQPTAGDAAATPEQGGATPEQCGSTPEQCGATPVQGGATPEQGGVTPEQGSTMPDAIPKQNCATPEKSGATPERSGAVPEQNGGQAVAPS